jgi:hypothetical protein
LDGQFEHFNHPEKEIKESVNKLEAAVHQARRKTENVGTVTKATAIILHEIQEQTTADKHYTSFVRRKAKFYNGSSINAVVTKTKKNEDTR